MTSTIHGLPRRFHRVRPLGAGLLAGLILAALDGGVLSSPPRPVWMVALTLATGVGLGAVWHWRGWSGALAAGAAVPTMHLARHLLGLPATIQPNTLDTIAMMALFSLAVSAAGLCGGVLLRQALTD